MGYQNDPKSNPNTVLTIDGENCHEGKKMSNHFNNFCSTITAKLVEQFPSGTCLYRAACNIAKTFYASRRNSDMKFNLKHATEEFVYKELCSLNISKSTGLDGIPARFLKDAAPILKVPVTFLINLSISEGQVPDELKMAKVKPLFKKNDRLKPENYRPVSILSIVSKVLEKAVYKQLENFLISNNLLFEFQSGFRSSYSSDSCLIHLIDHIKTETARALYTGMVFRTYRRPLTQWTIVFCVIN